jgi:DNA-binding NarL/FixJ family response regulator
MTFEQRVALMKPLSATEIQVLQHLADGLGIAEIAANRRTTSQVIKNYTYRACQKLGTDESGAPFRGRISAGIMK